MTKRNDISTFTCFLKTSRLYQPFKPSVSLTATSFRVPCPQRNTSIDKNQNQAQNATKNTNKKLLTKKLPAYSVLLSLVAKSSKKNQKHLREMEWPPTPKFQGSGPFGDGGADRSLLGLQPVFVKPWCLNVWKCDITRYLSLHSVNSKQKLLGNRITQLQPLVTLLKLAMIG